MKKKILVWSCLSVLMEPVCVTQLQTSERVLVWDALVLIFASMLEYHYIAFCLQAKATLVLWY